MIRLVDIDQPHRKPLRLGELTGHDECIRVVQRIHFEAGIPHLIAGTVFTVPRVFKARICLTQAGFQQSPISPAALVGPRSRCAIKPIERRLQLFTSDPSHNQMRTRKIFRDKLRSTGEAKER